MNALRFTIAIDILVFWLNKCARRMCLSRMRTNGIAILYVPLEFSLVCNTQESRMTYSIVARCPRTGQFGIGIASYSIAIGLYCDGALRANTGVTLTLGFPCPRNN